ncbi:MAG: hypothetical protein ACJ71A_08410, partial [Nitrososphaeraceae archaeon]
LHLLRNTIKSTIATVAPASNENVSILREKRISFSLEYICVVGERTVHNISACHLQETGIG